MKGEKMKKMCVRGACWRKTLGEEAATTHMSFVSLSGTQSFNSNFLDEQLAEDLILHRFIRVGKMFIGFNSLLFGGSIRVPVLFQTDSCLLTDRGEI